MGGSDAYEHEEREMMREVRARGFRSADDMQIHDYCMHTYGVSPIEMERRERRKPKQESRDLGKPGLTSGS